MLTIGRRSCSFSLTNRGRTKSWTLNCVSRTRFRKGGERRKRRGRCTNLFMRRGYARDATVASKRHLTLETLPCSACITQVHCFVVSGFHRNHGLCVDRYQSLLRNVCVCI